MEKFLSFYPFPDHLKKEGFTIEGMYAEWISSENCSKEKVILYLHGGGFSLGSCRTHRLLVGRIVRSANVKCLMIEYGLAPEKPFP